MDRPSIERRFVSGDSPTMGRAGPGARPCRGVYHVKEGSSPEVAFIAAHYSVDFLEHYLGEYLAELGFGFLGWNTRYAGREPYFKLDDALLDIGVGIRWLREVARASRVVILGNSGGGSLMAAYQARAGSSIAGSPRTEGDGLSVLYPADAYVSLNAHLGRPEVFTSWLDPSIVDERDPLSIDKSLDMYNRDNGPPYSEAFVAEYRAAQEERNHRITDWALEEQGRLAAAGVADCLFVVHRTYADLRFLDPAMEFDRDSPRYADADPQALNYGTSGVGRVSTLENWLEMWSLSTSQCRSILHLPAITAPTLIVQSRSDQSVNPADACVAYEALGSGNKVLEWIAGDHHLTRPGDGRQIAAELIGSWCMANGLTP